MSTKQVTAHVRVGDSFMPSNEERYLVEAMRKASEARQRAHMYGSSAAFCPRANFLYANLTTLQVETTPESVLYMNIGNGIESAYVEGLIDKNKLFYTNLRIPETRPSIGGKIDLIYLNANDEISIGEVKSCGRLPSKPKYSHMQQLLTYLAFGGYRRGYLIYQSRNVVAKNKVAMRVFEADVSDDSMFRILKKICFSQVSIDKNLMPGIPASFSISAECGYCTFRRECWDEEGKTDFVDTKDKMSNDQRKEILAESDEWAQRLMMRRTERYVQSLRTLIHETGSSNPTLLGYLIRELEIHDEL